MLPTTAKKLNAWLRTNYSVLDGAERAWLEFPFELSAQKESLYIMHRIVFITLGLQGFEEHCCLEIAKTISDLPISRESLLDKTVLLFIRRDFTYEQDPETHKGYVTGRIAFWDNTLNNNLRSNWAYKAEGALVNPAHVPEAS